MHSRHDLKTISDLFDLVVQPNMVRASDVDSDAGRYPALRLTASGADRHHEDGLNGQRRVARVFELSAPRNRD